MQINFLPPSCLIFFQLNFLLFTNEKYTKYVYISGIIPIILLLNKLLKIPQGISNFGNSLKMKRNYKKGFIIKKNIICQGFYKMGLSREKKNSFRSFEFIRFEGFIY